MDISSKYFSFFKYPKQYWVKYFLNFLVDIYQTNKSRELFSFIMWEIGHQLRIYQIRNKYIEFTNQQPTSITNDHLNSIKGIITSPYLDEQGLCFRAVAIDWANCFQTVDGVLWGYRYSDPNSLYYSYDQSQSCTLAYKFNHPITSFFISQQNSIFVCSNGVVYKSGMQANSFEEVLKLSTSISYFLFNNGMTELPDRTLIIGEYGSIWHGKKWQNLAFIYYSSDSGNTWTKSDFLIRQGVNKHIHLVKYSPLLNSIFLTDGDNKKQLWINSNLSSLKKNFIEQKNGWRLINKFHYQLGGYLSMAETNEAVLLGSDYLGGTNFIVKTVDGKNFNKLLLPDPYRRSPIMNMVCRNLLSENEIWASSFSCLSNSAKSLLMCTKDAGKSWTPILDFDGTKNNICLVNSSHGKTDILYITITEFGENHHRYSTYKLDHVSNSA